MKVTAYFGPSDDVPSQYQGKDKIDKPSAKTGDLKSPGCFVLLLGVSCLAIITAARKEWYEKKEKRNRRIVWAEENCR